MRENEKRSASARQFEKSIRIKAAVGGAVCTLIIGAGAAGYLYYDHNYSAGWHMHSDGTYYILSDGERAHGMQLINNSTYIFDENGNMLTGWQDFEGERYYLDKAGVLQRGIITIDGEEYYLADDSGILRTGLRDFNGAEYYFDDHGFPIDGSGGDPFSGGEQLSGWIRKDEMRYYYKADGTMATGLLEIDGNVYGFANDGHMLTGVQQVNGKTYDFGEYGAAYRGWREADGKYQYADKQTGAFSSGITVIDGKTYFFDTDLFMLTGEATIGDKHYLFGSDGVMFKGWYIDDSADKHYYREDGSAAIGSVRIDGDLYFFTENGKMRRDWYTDSETGLTYYCGKEGVVQSGFYGEGDDVYYFDPTTHAAVSGWLNLYPYPETDKNDIEKYLSDMKILKKQAQSLSDSSVTLTNEELQQFYTAYNKYGKGYDLIAKNAFDALGENVLAQQYFHEDFKMAQGFTEIGGTTFYFDPITGIKATGWQEIEGKRYYFGYMGAMVTGEMNIDGGYYVFAENGALANGLTETEGRLRWGKSDGITHSVWVTDMLVTDGDDTYYIDKEGYAVTGLREIDGKIYIFGEDCKLCREFVTADGALYYMTPKGAVTDKWVSVNKNTTYYFKNDGTAAIGWLEKDGITYWFDREHHMTNGVTKIGETTYYFRDGGLVRGPAWIDGKLHVLSKNGAMIKGWVSFNNKRYYCETAGIPLLNTTKVIDGVSYTFGSDGAVVG